MRRADKQIRETLPPVGGVINGAMFLRDVSFAEMSIDMAEAILAPKVTGSLLLDKLYRGPELDFFLLVSSLTACCGNLNQSMYGAANAFMAGLVRTRQQQGEAGSIMHLPQVRGLGYVAQFGTRLIDYLDSTTGPLYCSERDLLELLAETILAARPESNSPSEIAGGMRLVDPTKYPNLIWYPHLLMWPLIKYSQEAKDTGTESKTMSTKTRLLSATTRVQVFQIIRDGFQAKLRRKLHLPGESSIPDTTRLTELGVDSLVAVDLRLWFIKELDIGVSIIQLLGGLSIADLVTSVLDQLDSSLLPNVAM